MSKIYSQIHIMIPIWYQDKFKKTCSTVTITLTDVGWDLAVCSDTEPKALKEPENKSLNAEMLLSMSQISFPGFHKSANNNSTSLSINKLF